MIQKCYLCPGIDFELVSGVVRDRPEIAIKKCRKCGLVFLASFDHLKEDVYQKSGMHGGNVDMAAWIRTTEPDDERRAKYCSSFIKGKRVLDFGCGNGGFLIRSQEIAASVTGLDLEEALVAHFQAKGIRFVQSLQALQGEFFDVITLFHVLEHLPDPLAVLKELSRHLVPGGRIIIEVPNADDALLQLYHSEAFSRFTYWSLHLFLYTSKTLADLLHQAGASVQYIEHIQRYPLSNHLYWLAKQKPGGHSVWKFLDSPMLSKAYEESLAVQGMTDTVMASISFN